jgi:creatinine amidohydrolase
MQLSEATWTDVADLETELAVLPVGSTEQHGPHAPLGTDVLTARAIAEAGIEQYESEVLLAPPIHVGVAEEHRQFPGTLWVSPGTFRATVRETVASLASHGFDRVVIVNGHGGNVDALREVTATITRHDDAYAVAMTWFDAIDAEDMGHAGPVESALIRHLDPELVDEEELEAAREGGSDQWGEWVRGVNLAVDSVEFSDNGVVGDPTASDAERGAALLEEGGAALAELLEAVATRPLESSEPVQPSETDT